MPGKPRAGAAYWRQWRADHPAYRAREAERRRSRGRGDRRAEYARTAARRRSRAADLAPLAPLFPDLARGAVLAFWDEELAADLRQEAELARLEGRDPDEAVRRYRATEHTWRRLTAPLVDDVDEPGGRAIVAAS